jgi:esterase FrsA
MKRYSRSYQEAKPLFAERARELRNPMDHVVSEDALAVLDKLDTLEYEAWAQAWMAAAVPYEERAREAEERGDSAAAREAYLHAYGFNRVARYPCMNSPAKHDAYRKSQAMFLKAGLYMDPPVERVEMPFNGRPGEGSASIGLLRCPKADRPLPVIVAWGGIDSFKEERRVEPFLARGIAGLTIDMPGVADAPLPGSEDAERMWDAVLDWIVAEPRLDGSKVVLWGGSTGGYWAAKVAHTHRDRLAAVLEQGGAIHYAFQSDWIEKAQHGEYPFELAETLACAFGGSGFDYWVERAPKLSLLDQGVLDLPCAPMLCINGIQDSIFPIEDQYLLLEHGSPKSARFYNTGHMGHEPRTIGDMVTWVVETLDRGR